MARITTTTAFKLRDRKLRRDVARTKASLARSFGPSAEAMRSTVSHYSRQRRKLALANAIAGRPVVRSRV